MAHDRVVEGLVSAMKQDLQESDSVNIEGLTLYAHIGVYDWEQDIKQKLVLDITLYNDTQKAGVSDALEDALDYAAISETLKTHIETARFQLIERIAEESAQLILASFAANAVRIKVSKPGAVKDANNVSVSIFRGKS